MTTKKIGTKKGTTSILSDGECRVCGMFFFFLLILEVGRVNAGERRTVFNLELRDEREEVRGGDRISHGDTR